MVHYPACLTSLHFTPWQTCSFRHQLDFSGKHSAMLQLLRKDFSLTFPALTIARYSFKQLSELGRRGENENGQASKQQQSGFEHRLSRLRVRRSRLS